MDQFPPNSKTPKAAAAEPKKIERVASASAVRRRKPISSRFRETFISGDAKSTGAFVAQSVIVPAIKELLLEAGQASIERIIFGESRRPRGVTPNPYGHVNYNRPQGAPGRAPSQPKTSTKNRARNNFDEIVIDTRAGAAEVIDRMMDVISQYDVVTVADLYELTGFTVAHTDHKWGWTDLRGAEATRLRGGGYLLDLPAPQPLD